MILSVAIDLLLIYSQENDMLTKFLSLSRRLILVETGSEQHVQLRIAEDEQVHRVKLLHHKREAFSIQTAYPWSTVFGYAYKVVSV
jgi:hypothetical protein